MLGLACMRRLHLVAACDAAYGYNFRAQAWNLPQAREVSYSPLQAWKTALLHRWPPDAPSPMPHPGDTTPQDRKEYGPLGRHLLATRQEPQNRKLLPQSVWLSWLLPKGISLNARPPPDRLLAMPDSLLAHLSVLRGDRIDYWEGGKELLA